HLKLIDSVAFSRAGDAFHYRWAARRCLQLVYPKSKLFQIIIEGSKEVKKKGEYVIDLTEYYKEDFDEELIKYYQLKHTTTRNDIPFELSDLKKTLNGFAQRYSQHKINNDLRKFHFYIITNRKISVNLKKNICSLSKYETVNKRFRENLEKITELNTEELTNFCKLICFIDNEGDYITQEDKLRFDISKLIVGSVDLGQLESIVSLVHKKTLPNSNKIIIKEDILSRFGISSEKELFPAPPLWEYDKKYTKRDQLEKLLNQISNSEFPIIVHSTGGVGKTVLCKQLLDSLNSNSVCVAYDCFGNGGYRNRSEPRHRHRDALVQIINELALEGLCNPILVQNSSLNSDIMNNFLQRITNVVASLNQINKSGKLYILIDAADNAEMAAYENSEPCFANELLRETIPKGCKLVFFCRTERIHLLKPNSKITKFELKEFSEAETIENLKRWYPNANEIHGKEFHRLTSGNPRVQSKALNIEEHSIIELLNRLGPNKITVENQIEQQLNVAISNIKDKLSDGFKKQIDSICLGLACLPPHIPIDILSKSSNVTNEEIKSFISDFGHSIWLLDESIQFRDEPTETWFRKTFLASKEDFANYSNLLEQYATQNTYVSEVLPHLYLQAEKYEYLVEIALSDKFLPDNNPIDSRNVRIYRLQFAFRAALRLKKFEDAIKISIRAGEELAGNKRQLCLFQDNVDLIAILQDKLKVQHIAFKKLIRGEWEGSENVYTASLLSNINEYKGEALGFLRSAENWLRLYYNELNQNNDPYKENKVSENDIVELAMTYLNIYNESKCITILNQFNPKTFTFRIFKKIVKRLIDTQKFDVINNFSEICKENPYYFVAISSELFKVGKFPEARLCSYPKKWD
ncbi:MAG TPA: ATP-binding protein, partial [Bacteroidetes bacterium]|nr:ATP-binding protein [Bacteroidota bacterium]